MHLEQLPSNAVAVRAEARDYVSQKTTTPAIYISVWAPRQNPMSCSRGDSDESFVDSTCYDCAYHCEDMEFDTSTLDYPMLQTPEGELEVTGEFISTLLALATTKVLTQ